MRFPSFFFFAAALRADRRGLTNCPFNLLQAEKEGEEESVVQIKHPLSKMPDIKSWQRCATYSSYELTE